MPGSRSTDRCPWAGTLKQPVGDLVAAVLPGRVRISKPYVDIQTAHQLWVARQLRASVLSQTGAYGFVRLLQLAIEAIQRSLSCTSTHPAEDHKTRLYFNQCPYTGAVESPLYHIVFPGLGTSHCCTSSGRCTIRNCSGTHVRLAAVVRRRPSVGLLCRRTSTSSSFSLPRGWA